MPPAILFLAVSPTLLLLAAVHPPFSSPRSVRTMMVTIPAPEGSKRRDRPCSTSVHPRRLVFPLGSVAREGLVSTTRPRERATHRKPAATNAQSTRVSSVFALALRKVGVGIGLEASPDAAVARQLRARGGLLKAQTCFDGIAPSAHEVDARSTQRRASLA